MPSSAVVDALNTQLRVLVFFKRMQPEQFVKDRFFRLYAFSAFETDNKPALFSAYLERAFGVDLARAHEYLKEAQASFIKTPGDPAVVAGRVDGAKAIQGLPPKGLLKRYGYDFTAAVPPELIAEFRRYSDDAAFF